MIGTVVTITGPSCSGKSTLARGLACHGIHEVKSFTTRKPRADEGTMGVNRAYDFLTEEQVEAIPEDQLIELVRFNGNYYGNTVSQLRSALANGKGVATVVVEPQGVHHWRAFAEKTGLINVESIYMEQPLATLVKRFTSRLEKTDDLEYELTRLRNMFSVEHQTWHCAAPYNFVVKNYGDICGHTLDMVRGYLHYRYQR